MDAGQQTQTANINKPSAIPRLSKLPLPKTKSVQSAVQPPQAELSSHVKPSIATPRLQKRASLASFSRSTTSLPKEPLLPLKSVSSRTNLSNAANTVPKSSSRVTPASISSRSNLLRQPQSSLKSLPKSDDEENQDQLSSLDSFRSASRQGFHDDSPLESPDFGEPAGEIVPPRSRKTSRPSLSDRTMESLQTVPSTPKERRRSSFFNPVVSPMGPPPRPASSMSQRGGVSSRPGTSDGTFRKPISRPASPEKKAPASAIPSTRTLQGGFGFNRSTGSGRRVSTNLTSKLQDAKTQNQRPSSPKKAALVGSMTGHTAKISSGSKTVGSRAAKPRPALGDAFVPMKKEPSTTAEPERATDAKRVVSGSSAALRQQIAAAKAAARKERTMHDSPQDSNGSTNGSFEAEFHADPFNQAPRDEKHILRNRINTARMDGKLNIAAMGLKHIPEEVRRMYDSAAMEENKVNWAEVVDLTRFNAADNALEELDHGLFPDRSAEEFDADELSEGNQFGGLDLLDLHGNLLQSIPLGLRRLERLTTLDLAHNKLDNSVFDVISQIQSLKDLRLGHNALTGNLPTSVCGLAKLESLDIQANRLLGLPEALRELVSLRVLNVSGNQLTAVPMEALQQLPLSELDASSNALIASLFPLGGVNGHPTLRNLNVANNSLAALTFMEVLDMPQIRTLNVSSNNITVVPSMTGWTELTTLVVGDNKVSDFPQGFTTLQKLRHVNFTSNEIRIIDPEIYKMGGLESLVLAANPLREKKFLSMPAADIKRDLRSRLGPTEADESLAEEEPGSPVTVIGAQDAAASIWMLRGNGVLDLSSRDFGDEINDHLGAFLKDHEVKRLHLNANKLTCIPPALWLGQDLRVLDLSDCALSADYFSDELELPSLQELNLSKCRLNSLEPLLSNLIAPALKTLNISANRLSGPLPALREVYPSLTTLFASDNHLTSVTADTLRGLQAVNLRSNDLEALPAELGMLWDEGLRDLDVSSNAFRVPGWRVLEKGTEGLLRWLRSKMPEAEEEVD